MKRTKIKKPFYKQPFSMAMFIILTIYTISFLIPFFWTAMTALKSNPDFMRNKLGIPLYFRSEEWLAANEGIKNPASFLAAIKPFYEGEYGMFKNFAIAWDSIVADQIQNNRTVTIHIDHLFFNSLLYSVVATLITTFTHATCAYVAARYNQFPLMKLLYPIVIVTMIIPIVGSLPSSLRVMRLLHLYDELWGLWLVKGSFLGTNFLLFYACFKGISWEYAEAAFIDGASHAKVLFNIMMPLAKTTTVALCVLAFIGFWNDWNVNVVYMPSFPMVAYSLYLFRENVITVAANTPAKMAGCLIVAFPMFIFFLIFRNKLMGNLSLGGLKG